MPRCCLMFVCLFFCIYPARWSEFPGSVFLCLNFIWGKPSVIIASNISSVSLFSFWYPHYMYVNLTCRCLWFLAILFYFLQSFFFAFRFCKCFTSAVSSLLVNTSKAFQCFLSLGFLFYFLLEFLSLCLHCLSVLACYPL